jgi:hypothetical protein
VITVTNPPQALVTHFRFDGNLDDFGAAGNDGVFSNLQEPVFVDDPDGNPGQAVTFDGVDDFVQAQIVEDLPIYSNPAVVAFTVALWVRGLPQTDRRVYSESSSIDTNPLFNLGTQAAGTTGQVDVFIRPGPGHRLSQGIAFDGEWHHLAWVDSCGDAALYIDGVQDPTDFTYVKPDMALDTTTVGGILRATACCWFLGDIDDVRVYNYALTPAEIMEIIEGQPPGRPEFHRGDTTGEGTLNITDGVAIFNWLFLGGPTPPCLESANANDSPAINITTGVYLLNFLFLGGPAPPPPGPPPAACAADPLASPTDLGCESYAGCGA